MARLGIGWTLRRVQQRREAPERGFTLVEMLIAVTLLGAIVIAMAGAMFTVITVSSRQQSVSNAEAAARRYAEMVRAVAYTPCAPLTGVNSYNEALHAFDSTLPATVKPVTRMRWWDGAPAMGSSPTWNEAPTPCVDKCMQLVDVQATVGTSTATLSVVKRGDTC